MLKIKLLRDIYKKGYHGILAIPKGIYAIDDDMFGNKYDYNFLFDNGNLVDVIVTYYTSCHGNDEIEELSIEDGNHDFEVIWEEE